MQETGIQDDEEHLKGTLDRCSLHRTGHTQIKMSRRLDRVGVGAVLTFLIDMAAMSSSSQLVTGGFKSLTGSLGKLIPLSMEGLQLQSGLPLSHLRPWTTPVRCGHFQVPKDINNLTVNIFENKVRFILSLTGFLSLLRLHCQEREFWGKDYSSVKFLQGCWFMFPCWERKFASPLH